MIELVFRSATTDDVEDLLTLVTSAYRGDTSRAGWTTEADFLAGSRIDCLSLQTLVSRPGSRVVLGTNAGRLMACAHIEQDHEVAHFGMFAVSPTEQGQGLGRQMLRECERIAREEWRRSSMQMCVIDIRNTLIAFYERRGYRRTGLHLPFPYGDERFGIPLRADLRFEVLEKRLIADS